MTDYNSVFPFQVEEVKITIPMPKCVTNVNPTCTCKSLQFINFNKNYLSPPFPAHRTNTVGLPSYDPVNWIVTWNVNIKPFNFTSLCFTSAL